MSTTKESCSSTCQYFTLWLALTIEEMISNLCLDGYKYEWPILLLMVDTNHTRKLLEQMPNILPYGQHEPHKKLKLAVL
jgi:hypothetical protein